MEATAKEKLKIPYGKVQNKNLVGASLSASEVKYTQNKWRAISMFAESSCNMIVLMSAYITQSVITDLMGALTPDKGLYKHLIKVHSRNANDKINETIESIINKDRDDAQVNYLYAYTDALDAKMRPRVQTIKKEIEKVLVERGCKKANVCAWTLTCEGLARMTCQLFINVMTEIKEMFRCDMSQKYIQYYIDDVYDELKGLVYELGRKFPEINGIDVQNMPQTAKIFEEIDDDIRNAECLDAAADEANNEFDDERKQKNMERVEHILAEIGNEIEEHKTKYSTLTMRHYCIYKYQSPSSLRYVTVEGEIVGTVFNSKTNDEEFILQVEPESSYQEPYYTAAPIRNCRPIKKLSRNKTK